jgi:hypothetical protein
VRFLQALVGPPQLLHPGELYMHPLHFLQQFSTAGTFIFVRGRQQLQAVFEIPSVKHLV